MSAHSSLIQRSIANVWTHAQRRSHWHWGYLGYLAQELNAEVVVVPYPLAPTNTALEVMPIVLEVYEAFFERA